MKRWTNRNTVRKVVSKEGPPTDFSQRSAGKNSRATSDNKNAGNNVLGFKAYFLEAVHFSSNENHRVRVMTIQYFLGDDTIAIVEPRQLNAGITQGAFLKRQKCYEGACRKEIATGPGGFHSTCQTW